MKRLAKVCLLAAAGLGAARPLAAATVGDPVASRSAEGRARYEAGDYDGALRAYRDALVERSESEALHLNVGDALYQLGDYEGARQEFERAARAEDPALAAQGQYNKGNAHFQLRDFPAAVQAYREALKKVPQDADAKANLELALRMLQPPPPSPQGGGEDQEDHEGGEESGKGESSPSPPESEPEKAEGDEAAAGEHRPATPPGPSAAQDLPPSVEGDAEPMDREAAERLLDALRDREEEAQQLRHHVAQAGDDPRDW